jgi:hypothetical protein
MDEKRKFTRVELERVARVRGDGETYRGKMQNLSLSGVFVTTQGRPALGSEVDVEIIFTGPKTELAVEIRAKVTRHDDTGFGVAFALESMELDSFLHLRNIIAYLQGDRDRIAAEFQDLLKEHAALHGEI